MKPSLHNDLGRALRVARTATGRSQESFSDVSGRTYISQLERGERHATLNKIDELAAVLGIHPASLVLSAYLPNRCNQGSIDALLAVVRADLVALSAAST